MLFENFRNSVRIENYLAQQKKNNQIQIPEHGEQMHIETEKKTK